MGSVHIKDEARIGSEAKLKLEPSVYLQKLYKSGTPDLGWMNNMGEWGVRAKPGNLALRPKSIVLACRMEGRRHASYPLSAATRGSLRPACPPSVAFGI